MGSVILRTGKDCPTGDTCSRIVTILEVTVLDALYWVCALVLVVSGASKLTDGDSVRVTLSQLGFPAPARVGTLVGVFEVLVGAAALMARPGAVASVVAVLVALIYAVFALVVVSAMRAGLADCGCIGVRPTRPGAGHVVFNLVASLVAVASAVTTPVDLVGGLAEVPTPWAIVIALAVAVTAGSLVSLPGR